MTVLTRSNYNTPSTKQDEFFSDFTTDLMQHPVTGELSRLTNEAAVKRSLRNILLTNKTERLFNPKFGGNLIRLLFEPMNSSTVDSLKNTINDTIRDNEPRVKLSSIEVIPDELNQSYRVNIIFLMVNRKEPTGLTVTLQRVR